MRTTVEELIKRLQEFHPQLPVEIEVPKYVEEGDYQIASIYITPSEILCIAIGEKVGG